MAVTLSQAEIDAVDSDTQRIGVFFRLDVDPVQRLWLGVGDCQVGANAYDEEAAVYSGLGQLVNVPAVQQLINGLADRVTFTISGVSPDVLVLAASESGIVTGAAVALGIALFDGAWQQLGVPKWLFRGVADVVTLDQVSDPSSRAITRTISLSVGSLFTGRRRRGLSYLTDQDQKTRHPGDRFCERVSLYTAQVTKVWPKFTS